MEHNPPQENPNSKILKIKAELQDKARQEIAEVNRRKDEEIKAAEAARINAIRAAKEEWEGRDIPKPPAISPLHRQIHRINFDTESAINGIERRSAKEIKEVEKRLQSVLERIEGSYQRKDGHIPHAQKIASEFEDPNIDQKLAEELAAIIKKMEGK